MNENIFRILAAIILFTGMGISIYYRRKADNDTGEKISRKVDGSIMMTIIKIGGLILLAESACVSHQSAMDDLVKDWTARISRWIGVGIGILCVLGIYWLFSSIGSGITPTSATRKQHTLVTSGPYRWVRHPLYTVGSSMFISFGMMADNWFIAALGVLAFIAMAIRTPKEEANLIEKFGDEYREYMKTTGRFLPYFGRGNFYGNNYKYKPTRMTSTLHAASEVLSGTGQKGFFARLLPFLGRLFIACVAYVDPGNFATNIQGGAQFGYMLLWVIVASNLMAMLIQTLSAKLGIATGKNLAELCREHFPRPVCDHHVGVDGTRGNGNRPCRISWSRSGV